MFNSAEYQKLYVLIWGSDLSYRDKAALDDTAARMTRED